MKFTYFHHNCWKKLPKMIGRLPWISQESPKLYCTTPFSQGLFFYYNLAIFRGSNASGFSKKRKI